MKTTFLGVGGASRASTPPRQGHHPAPALDRADGRHSPSFARVRGRPRTGAAALLLAFKVRDLLPPHSTPAGTRSPVRGHRAALDQAWVGASFAERRGSPWQFLGLRGNARSADERLSGHWDRTGSHVQEVPTHQGAGRWLATGRARDAGPDSRRPAGSWGVDRPSRSSRPRPG